MDTRDHYQTLKAVGRVISFVGWALAGLGLLTLLFSVGKGEEGVIRAIGSAIGLVLAMLLVAAGQAIQCLADIERNTRRADDRLRQIALVMAPNIPRPASHHAAVQTAVAADQFDYETTCDTCGMTFGGDRSGQHCPNCGAMLTAEQTAVDSVAPQSVRCELCGKSYGAAMRGRPCPECGATI